MTDIITRSTRGHVAEIIFSHPPHNHANVAVLGAIADELDRIDADPAIRAVVLSSEGRIFCAGADLATKDGFGGSSADPLREFYDAALRIFDAKKPIIAAVQGAAVGAGLGLAVAADFRVAAPEARFAANFTRLGFHPGFGLTVTLPRVIGQQRALEMFMTSGRYKPEDVAPWGLVDRLAPSGGALDVAHELAAEIAENAPLATVATRATMRGKLAQAVRERLLHEHAEQNKLKITADYAEGVASVFERRAANFTGR
jgi:enoyl-CoA hydratase/carnithine racemase